MKALTTEEARKWCSQCSTGLRVTRYDVLRYKHPREHKFCLAAPEEYRMISPLAYHILTFRSEESFAGGFLWLHRWDIGSPQLVRPGWRILEDMRRAHGELRSLEAAPAQSFRVDEIVELHAFLIQVVAFDWVADFIPLVGGFFLHFKDNRQICVAAESSETLKELRTHFQDWNPTDEDPMVVKMAAMEKARKKARQKIRPGPK
jgi:hypothetical protein